MEADLKAALLGAYARLLKPLVRILLRNGVSYPEFAQTAKRVFVLAVAPNITKAELDLSASHIAIRTGLTKSEVLRVFDQDSGLHTEGRLAVITRVLSGWHTDARFTGPYGIPLELTLHSDSRPSFESLIQTYSPDTPAAGLLAELVRIGAVKETETGWYRILTRTYLPKVDVPDSLERIGQAVQFLVETVDFNRQETNPDLRLLERTVSSDTGIKPEDLPRLKRYIRERAQVLLEEIDNWLSQLDPPDKEQGEQSVRTGVGIYHYVELNDDTSRK